MSIAALNEILICLSINFAIADNHSDEGAWSTTLIDHPSVLYVYDEVI